MGAIDAHSFLQVNRVLAVCFHSSCWTMALLPLSWGCGVAWVL